MSPIVNTILSCGLLLASPRITNDEAAQIRNFLATEYGSEILPTPAESTLLERHCLPCHHREKIFSTQRGRSAWLAIVTKMHVNERTPPVSK